MSAYLDEQYFNWLYNQVCSVKSENPSKTYKKLFHILYTKEFIWLVPNDDNRVEDGKYLRFEFFEDIDIKENERDAYWLNLGCSMLEFFVALSRRLAFQTEASEEIWFWHLLENIELHDLNDRVHFTRDEVEDVLDRVIWRTYNYNGGGGLFPLLYPEEDQRKIEIWYQFNAYIIERRYV